MRKKFDVKLEKRNGDKFCLNSFIRNLTKTQDMESWAKDPKEFEAWIKDSIKMVIDNIDVVIVQAQ